MPVTQKQYEKNKLVNHYLVEEHQHGMRLDQFIQIYLSSFSRQKIKKKIDAGEITIIGRPGKIRPSSRIQNKDMISMIIHRTTHEDEWWNGKKLEIEEVPPIIFEDDNLLVIDKPPFMATHPTGRHVFNCATIYFETIHKRTIHSIHRLDRETSGTLLLAKSPKTAQIMTDHFEKGLVRKCYFFISKIDNTKYDGKKVFEVNDRLSPKGDGLERVIIISHPENSSLGKKAQTHFEIMYVENDYAIGLAFPRTGRQHQIRVHAALRGLPLVGDKLYLGNYPLFQRFKDNLATPEDHELMEIPRHALHSIGLSLPYENKIEHFIGHIPQDLKEWIQDKLTISVVELEKKIKARVDDYFSETD
ncbi:MAG: RluA family pseudouridine synthase [Bacteriovoracaceae bacterium]|nr:RluA family pseudouridine synthase [Bacteriovoracaceae bacterium]